MRRAGGNVVGGGLRAAPAGALAIWLAASWLSAQPATSPKRQADWFGQAVTAVEACLWELAQIRVCPDGQAGRVAGVVKKASALLDESDQRLTQELGKLPPSRPPAPRTEVPPASGRRVIQDRRCRLALLRGELYCAAALAVPEDEKARLGYLDSAISIFRSLRVVHLDLPLAWMGYLGEAKAQRLARRFGAAQEALGPILEMPVSPREKLSAELRRAAMLEKLEIGLAAEPAKAVTESRAWRKSPEVAGEPTWQARIAWLEARALAAEAARLKAAGDRAGAARDVIAGSLALLRAKPVVGAAPAYERLALLAHLDALADGEVMTRAELLQWSDALAAVGNVEATVFYRRAASMPGASLSPDQQYNCAALLWRKGDLEAAADACDALLKQTAPEHPRRVATLRLRAAALLKLYRRTDANELPAGLPERLLSDLEDLIQSGSPDEVRRDALRQWVDVQRRRAGPGACVKMLSEHERLVGADAYLLYARAAGSWSVLSADARSVPGPQLAERARRAAAECRAAQQAAERAGAGGLAARSVLLRARIVAAPPLRDPRAALEVLREGSGVLAADEAVDRAAAWLRAETLLDLGLTDEAMKVLSGLPGTESAGPTELRIRLAEALADRYAGADPAGRRQVVELCSQALAAAVGDARRYAATARRSARAMLKVGAHVDAEAILEKLLQSDAVRKDAAAWLDCSLMLAEAMQKGDKWNQAKARLENLAEEVPRSAAVHLALGRLEMSMKQPAAAVVSFRRARNLCKPGSARWCRCTLALAEGLHEKGDAAAAGDILRVSHALYPRFGSPELLTGWKRLTERLKLGLGPSGS